MRPPGRVEHDRDRVRDRVRDPDELHRALSDLDRPGFGIDLPELGRAEQAVLVELRLDQAHRQARRPDLVHAALAQEIRKPADVVLVRVREQHRADRPFPVAEVGEVREDQVDAEVLVPREREPRVDHESVVPRLDDRHVLADLAEASERNDPRAFRHRSSLDRSGSRLSDGDGVSDRSSVRLSVLAYATVAAGLGVAVAGAYAAVGKPLTALALLGAAALAAELLEEPEGGRVRAPVGPGVFRVASGVDIAAVIVLGPWRGALVAGAAALLGTDRARAVAPRALPGFGVRARGRWRPDTRSSSAAELRESSRSRTTSCR